jgi:hypothetical protein
LAVVEQAIQAFSRHFITMTMQDLMRREQAIIYDFDLTG